MPDDRSDFPDLEADDELTIDGADLLAEIRASQGPVALESQRWRPPAAARSSLAPTPELRNGRVQLLAGLIAVLLSLGAAAWLGHTANAAPTQGSPALEGEEGQ